MGWVAARWLPALMCYGWVLLQFLIWVFPSCATCKNITVFEISAFSQINLKFINGFRSFWERGIDTYVNRKAAQQNLCFLKKYKCLFSSVAELTTHTNNREKRASSQLQNGIRKNDSASLAPIWTKCRYIITLLEHQSHPRHDVGTAASVGICIWQKDSFW